MKTREQIIEKKLDFYLTELGRITWKTKDLKFISCDVLCKNEYGILIKMNVVDINGNDITHLRDFNSPFNLIEIKRGSLFFHNGIYCIRYNENIIHTIKQIISHRLSYYLIERCVKKKRAN